MFRRILLALPVAVIGLVLGWSEVENRLYAGRVFDGIAAGGEVLASRRWHGILALRGCSYAVVTLEGEAPPPAAGFGPRAEGRGLFYRFGGDWAPTPGPRLADSATPGAGCSDDLGVDLHRRLDRALALPGGWWSRTGDTLHLWSGPAALAFRLREGD
jgi:hypothetical protein